MLKKSISKIALVLSLSMLFSNTVFALGSGESEIVDSDEIVVEVETESTVEVIDCSVVGHDLVKKWTIPPNCYNEGYTWYDCSRCDYAGTGDHVAELGHSFVVAEVVEPTCSSVGYDVLICSVCGKETHENQVPATSHLSYKVVESVSATCYNEEYHIEKCVACGDTKKIGTAPAAHKFENGVCVFCNKGFKKEDVGYTGDLVISDVGLEVDIYDYEISGKYEDIQTTTDRGNSAVYFTQDGQKIIADHVDQGFYKIKNVVPGHTVATVNGEEYICTSKFNGFNDGHTLLTLNSFKVSEEYSDSLVMYTCNGHWTDITITLWKPLNK